VRAAELYATIDRVVAQSRRSAGTTDAADSPAATGTAVAAPSASSESLADSPWESPGNVHTVRLNEALDSVGGDSQLLTEIARIFLVEAPRLAHDIAHALTTEDATLLRRSAHTIKSGLRMFGAEQAYQLALSLESLGESGHLAEAREPFIELQQAVWQIQQQLTEFLNRSKPLPT
jgi:two-component system, sensor histidine kinase and response regulator